MKRRIEQATRRRAVALSDVRGGATAIEYGLLVQSSDRAPQQHGSLDFNHQAVQE